jgi:hypothetical protein
MRRLAFGLMLVLAGCSSTAPPVSQADAQQALCADLASASPTDPREPAMRRLLADADLFERAGDNRTADRLRKLVKALRIMERLRREKMAMAVFLRDEATQSQISAIQQALSEAPGVASVSFESKADAFARFRRLFADQPDLIAGVSEEALPASFRARLSSPAIFDELVGSIELMAGVERVTVDLTDASDQAMGLAELPALRKCLTSPAPASP